MVLSKGKKLSDLRTGAFATGIRSPPKLHHSLPQKGKKAILSSLIFTFQRDHIQNFEGQLLGHRTDKGPDNFQKDLHTFQREEKLLRVTSGSFNKRTPFSLVFHREN